MNENGEPKTLIEALRYFSDPDRCLDFVANLRWADGQPICPTCGSPDVRFISTRRIWECKSKHTRRQFSIKIGTIFEDSAIALDKWLAAIWMIANAKNGASSYEIARSLGVTQKSGWFMLHRIRLAMQTEIFTKISGQIEIDETFIGGKARNMHRSKREAQIAGRGCVGKTAVMGLLERHGPDGHSAVRAKVVDSIRRRSLSPEVRRHVEDGSEVFTDALSSYDDLGTWYEHQVINHAESYARGKVHTNGIENFWSLLKRAIKGTYVSVEPFHLFRYLDQQTFRYNSRKADDCGRFQRLLGNIEGRRLTYGDLTGATTTPC